MLMISDKIDPFVLVAFAQRILRGSAKNCNYLSLKTLCLEKKNMHFSILIFEPHSLMCHYLYMAYIIKTR